MRRERSNVEEQVGGLIDHRERRARRREAPHASEADEPQRYSLTPQATVAIRAERASSAPAHRRVA